MYTTDCHGLIYEGKERINILQRKMLVLLFFFLSKTKWVNRRVFTCILFGCNILAVASVSFCVVVLAIVAACC